MGDFDITSLKGSLSFAVFALTATQLEVFSESQRGGHWSPGAPKCLPWSLEPKALFYLKP